MKNAHWLVLVAIAAMAGFWAGSWEALDTWKARGLGDTNTEGGSGSRVAKSGGRPSVGGKSNHTGVGAGKDSLANLVERYWLQPALEHDPFGGWIGSGVSEALTQRIVSAIYQAEEAEFPGILAHARKGEGEDLKWEGELLTPMIRRWCDFDPEAALAWFRANSPFVTDADPDPFGGDDLFRGDGTSVDLTPIIAEEALDSDPDWALALAREWLSPASDTGDAHMISSMRTGNFAGDRFLYDLVLQHPERALDFLAGAGGMLEMHGFAGWSTAMFELGREGEVSAYLNRMGYEESSNQRRSFTELLSKLELSRAQAVVAADGGALQDAVLLQSMVQSVGQAEAEEWFMERGTDSEDREERAGILVNSRAVVRSFRDRVVMADRFLAEGVNVRGAYMELIQQSTRHGATDLGFEMVGNLSDEMRPLGLQILVEHTMETFWADSSGESLQAKFLPAAVRQQAEAAGLQAEVTALVREENDSQSVDQMIALLEGLRADLDGAPPVPEPVADE